jgi:putative endonuclease
MNPVKDRFYYVYILQSLKNKNMYTGFTNDLRKRFNEHQENKSTYTNGRGPFKLIYYEASLHKEDAVARELYLKSGMGKRYLKNRLKRSLSLTG